jgi:drug efflux transport system ATP-binding protein
LAEIAAVGLVKRFGRVEALRGVDLAVPAGALWAVVGPDGAGKTTLMRCIAGLYRPDAGRAEPGVPGQGRVGLAAQGFHLYADLTVDENLVFFGRLYGLGRDLLRERAEDLLGFTGLARHRRRLAGDLSGGLRQRLTLACALVHRPPVLLLDEPTTGVDPVARRDFWELVTRLHVDGATILLASAYFDEVERCEHVVYLHGGRVHASGAPEELVGSHASLEEAFLAVTS